MVSQEGERDFTVDREIVIANFGLALLAGAVGVFALWRGQSTAIGLILFALGFVAFALHLLLTKVTLTSDCVKIASALGRAEYLREQVSDTRWTYGAPVEIELKDVGWIRLPYLGPHPTALHVSLRYWIHGT